MAENWYFEHLGYGLARADFPSEPLEKLERVRANTRKMLPQLIGDERILAYMGEFCSARKAVRRILWHERDPAQHIEGLLSKMS